MTKSCDRDEFTGALSRDSLKRFLKARDLTSNDASPAHFLAFVDMDNFKAFNAHNGHQVGDEVLKRFVTHVGDMIGNLDSLFRYGGNSFVIVLADHRKATFELLQQICFFARTSLSPPQPENCGDAHCRGPTKLSVSIGVVELKRGISTTEALQKAEDQMYRAKRSGRDQVCMDLLLEKNTKP